MKTERNCRRRSAALAHENSIVPVFVRAGDGAGRANCDAFRGLIAGKVHDETGSSARFLWQVFAGWGSDQGDIVKGMIQLI
jgi:hypothetical protein